MAHENLKSLLAARPGELFVELLTNYVYEWSLKIPAEYYNYKIFEELTVRYSTGEYTKKNLHRFDNYRFDVVFFIEPGWSAIKERSCYTVGIELKNSRADLMQDEKIEKYIGFTDFFFIGVPKDLVPAAIEKSNKLALANKVGVMAVDTGGIAKLGERIMVKKENKIMILEQVLYNTIFRDMTAKGIVSFKADEVEVTQPALLSPNVGYTEIPQNNLSNSDKLNNLSENDKLNKEDKEEKRERYRQNKEENKAIAIEMAQKSSTLSEEARKKLIALSPKDQKVFWCIRENEHFNSNDIQSAIEAKPATVNRSIASLTAAGLVKRIGSRKTGTYAVSEIASCDTTCATCAIALTCHDYKPVSEDG